MRTADTIARLGGDEFGILIQHCNAEQAARMAENIRQAILDYRFSWEETTSSIGASIGVVEITRRRGERASRSPRRSRRRYYRRPASCWCGCAGMMANW